MAEMFDLMVAPTGARLSKADHSALPVSVAEIVETAQACAKAGATSIHLHVRDENGAHTLCPDLYNRAIAAIQSRTHLRVQISTEAIDRFTVTQQQDCLRQVKADWASIALREVLRDPDKVAETYALAANRGIEVQHILYTPDEVTTLLRLFDQGTIPAGRHSLIFVLGRYATGQQSTPSDLTPFLQSLGSTPYRWATCAFGQQEHACLLSALDQGGDVRVGFENNRLTPSGRPYPDNAASVVALLEAADKMGFTTRKAAA